LSKARLGKQQQQWERSAIMGFPIFYNGKILFRNGKPAFSVNCCCDSICINDCGAVLDGVFLEVRTLKMEASGQFAWTYNDGVDSFVANQSGPVEHTGGCTFRIPSLFIVPPNNTPIPGFVQGSYINNVWTFTALGKTVTIEETTNDLIIYVVSPNTISMFPNMDPC